jgi:CubicO group peptidase (beta-lactamase class C family)
MDALELVATWPVDAAAVGVVRWDPGTADGPDSRCTTGDVDRRWGWASVTKPATALAVLVAVEEGTLELDGPAGPPGSTVRHLLAHTSGLGPEPGPPVESPGTRRIYSNAGFVALAELLEERSGIPFADYLAQGVLGPLGMTGAILVDVPSGPAAAGLTGSLLDLMALAREWARPQLVSQTTWREATSVQFPDTAGVLPGFGPFDPCDWGLGVEVKGAKRPHWTGPSNSPSTFGHFGQTGSFLWVDPVAGVLCCGLADRPFGVWANQAWPTLADEVLAEAARA